MDATTFLMAGSQPTTEKLPTFGVLFRGAQVAATPVSFQMVKDCTLIRIMFGTSGVLVSTQRIIAGLVSSFSSRADVIALSGTISNMVWEGRRPLKSGEFIWIDSIGGLGANDTVNLEFETVSPTP